ncbi:hypothetical protein ACJIZ3_004806 [Penstemon smallii]|uniref:Uncharacterized protein n=1 Tax=Penstemon smallii TaxID=265156 RepID=A0ABD3S351_9LAMI
MCLNFPYTLKKGKLIIVRKGKGNGDGGEEKEEVGLLVKEIEKWNKRKSQGRDIDDVAVGDRFPSIFPRSVSFFIQSIEDMEA